MINLRNLVAGTEQMAPTCDGDRPYINLDNAASTPPFKSVMSAVNEFAPWYSSVHRGNGYKSRLSTELYEQARRVVGDFFGADPSEHEVIFGKNTTEAINKLAYRLGLRKRDVVLISHLEHHSNDLPWRARATVKRISLTKSGGINRHDFLNLLDRYAGRIKLVAISGASNVTGHMPDIHWFACKAHSAGAQILIDCAQLAPHRPIDVKHLNDPEHLDYIAISSHKMYAPFGTGALIGRRDTFTHGEPEYRGGGTIELVTASHVDWAMPPDSEEAGSPNVIGAIALARAIKTLQQIGMDTVKKHESDLTAYALKLLKDIPGLTIYGDISEASVKRRTGVIPLTMTGISPNLVATILGWEYGIGVRSGCFCAHPYVLDLLNVNRGGQAHVRYNLLHKRRDLMPGMVRISFGIYNTRQEIDRLAEALRAISQGLYGEYTVNPTTGCYTAANMPETPPPHFKI